MKIKRINRANGEESFVSLDYAVRKLALVEHLKPIKNDKQNIKDLLISGSHMGTYSFLYKKADNQVNGCGKKPLARLKRLIKDVFRDVDTANY